MFEVSKVLKKYLEEKPVNTTNIIGALIGYINSDPKFLTNDFDEALKYVLKSGISESELYQIFEKDSSFIDDEENWNNEYFALALVYLKQNFCKERIAHVKAISKKIHKENEKKSSTIQSTNRGSDEGKHKSQQNKTTQKNVGAIIPIVGIIAFVMLALLIVNTLK